MVEEDEYRSTYHAINNLRCVFEKTILTHKSACSQSTRFFLADREGIRCNSVDAHQNCAQLLPILRQKAIFALQLQTVDEDLPFTKEIRVQTGGIQGLQRLLNDSGENTDTIPNIHELVNQALATYGAIDNLPFQEIVQSISRFKGRERNKRSS